jgi:hypothetical protein
MASDEVGLYQDALMAEDQRLSEAEDQLYIAPLRAATARTFRSSRRLRWPAADVFNRRRS